MRSRRRFGYLLTLLAASPLLACGAARHGVDGREAPGLEACYGWSPRTSTNPITSLEAVEAIVRSERHLPEGCGAALRAKARATDFATTRLYISHAIELPEEIERDDEAIVIPFERYCGGVRRRPTTLIIELPLTPEPIRVERRGGCGNLKRP